MHSFNRIQARKFMAKVLAELDQPARIAMIRDAVAAQQRGERIEQWAERVLAARSPGQAGG